ncbi:Uncharacterized conserved protein YbjT, contains NAD(P)-binding and DUF2867 domains [Actinokineospora alba]|uniref:Uncharacterized conserved protein YbjT, contains NAD(P)-binding and DUF2867 domains n=1 Tax=Actinokineospora alba TaxID=504798 RepID=A0A1H0HRV6_9PSEU|nr:SDR family oxidoreductase [Actinokineospora alba]TDP64774.1 uncharacterized protein YbjT (DUF2867 family) [Actinokineospora alba]SDH45680.1 Uncharacterized conserved protein YbjT, contains NAD(P)-binding and DUF2867 domains [Actinokineospora alba]SDO21867.1 Uncharacterized conserved protein YbjT, contains NAD(P)-binding and DUF2867 domains [Actinokineospora alba]
MILVAGATGSLGRHLTRTLLDDGKPLRVLVREGSPYDELVAAGAEPVIADLKDPDSLATACAGVDSVVTTANATARGGADTIESVDRQGNLDLVDAAEAAGVRRFLFVSALGARPGHPLPLLNAKGETEQRLRESGMAWTVVQPNLYMDKLIPIVVGGPALAGQPVTLVGDGRRHHSYVAMRDVAAYLRATLDHPRAQRQTLVVGGPQPLSWRDIIAAFERELGYPVPVHTVEPGEPVPGRPEFITELLTMLETYDSPLDVSGLASTYGVTPTPLAEYVRGFVTANRVHAG